MAEIEPSTASKLTIHLKLLRGWTRRVSGEAAALLRRSFPYPQDPTRVDFLQQRLDHGSQALGASSGAVGQPIDARQAFRRYRNPSSVIPSWMCSVRTTVSFGMQI
jgi:hypothetical protein